VQTRGAMNLLRTILHAALDLGALDGMPKVPKLGKQGRKLPDAPSDDEVEAMLKHACPWLRTAIAFAAYAGLRMGEVRALEVRDVDLEGSRLLIRHALSENEVVTPKSGNERPVPLSPPLRAALTDALRGKLPRARVITNGRGSTPGRQYLLAALKNLQRRAGLDERSFHSLRHYFCSTMVRHHASLEAVRELAGHSSIAITQRYVHSTGTDMEDAISKLPGN